MDIFKNACLYIIGGIIINGFGYLICSDFLPEFLHDQIITICITLAAITSAVRGIILAKLVDVGKLYKEINFQSTFKELKNSIYEQTSMLFIAIILLISYWSKQLPDNSIFLIHFSIDSILTAILFFNIYILCDTGIAVINIFSAIDTQNKHDE